MAIDVHHIASPLSGRFIMPQGGVGIGTGTSCRLHFAGHLSHNVNSSKNVRSGVLPTTYG
jgi:hypothetical protein